MVIEKKNTVDMKTEVEGAIEIPTTKGTITLNTKADRIDVTASRQACIVDYKTGMVPSKKAVGLGYAPQLPLEGVILKGGGFPELPPMAVEKLCYWKVTGGTPAGEIISLDNTTDLLDAAERGVQRLFEAFFAQETPFYACPDRLIVPAYHHYSHLERLKEWG
jgi:ATP-dependent helicase/nuclease subunit B